MVVPGNLDYKRCAKYSNFKDNKSFKGKSNEEVTGNVCDGLKHMQDGKTQTFNLMINGHNSSGIMKGDLSGRSISSAAWELYFVGLIENMPRFFWIGSATEDADVYSGGTGMFVDGCNLAPISFEETYGKVEFVGWHFDKVIDNKWNVLPGSNTFHNKSAKHEFDNKNFVQIIDHHNTIFFAKTAKRMDAMTRDADGRYDYHGEVRNVEPIVSSRIASQLDAKIDDGRPGKGKLLSFKGPYGYLSTTNEDQQKQVCYDQTADNVYSAIYNNSTNMKFGCNLMKVMEDVK